MPIGGSALTVPGSWQARIWCDKFAGLNLTAKQSLLLEGWRGQGVYQQFTTRKVQLLSASANLPF